MLSGEHPTPHSSAPPSPASLPSYLRRISPRAADDASSALASVSASTRVKKLKFDDTIYEIRNGGKTNTSGSSSNQQVNVPAVSSSSAPSSFPSLATVGFDFSSESSSTSPLSPSLLSPLTQSGEQNLNMEGISPGSSNAGSGPDNLTCYNPDFDEFYPPVSSLDSVHSLQAARLASIHGSIQERYSSPDMAPTGVAAKKTKKPKKSSCSPRKPLSKTTSSSSVLPEQTALTHEESAGASQSPSLHSSSSQPHHPTLRSALFSSGLSIPLSDLKRRKSSSTPPSPRTKASSLSDGSLP